MLFCPPSASEAERACRNPVRTNQQRQSQPGWRFRLGRSARFVLPEIEFAEARHPIHGPRSARVGGQRMAARIAAQNLASRLSRGPDSARFGRRRFAQAARVKAEGFHCVLPGLSIPVWFQRRVASAGLGGTLSVAHVEMAHEEFCRREYLGEAPASKVQKLCPSWTAWKRTRP